MSLGEGGQEELAVVFNGFEEVLLALKGQCLLHLTGAAGVVLRTEPQVLTYAKIQLAMPEGDTRLGVITYFSTYLEKQRFLDQSFLILSVDF